MGTRSLTEVHDEDGKVLTTVYSQFDGYPSGQGDELKRMFGDLKIVYGIGGGSAKIANGAGCLAAQLVSKMKDGPGGVYLYPPGTRDCGEEFVYVIKPAEKENFGCGPVQIDVYGGPMTFFGGSSEVGATKPIWSGLLRDFDADEADANYEKAMNSARDGGENMGPKEDQPAA